VPLIREYRTEDAQLVEDCIVELQDYCKAIDPLMADGKTVAKDYLRYLLAECARTNGKIFVAETDEKVVGMVCVFGNVPCEGADEEEYAYAYISDLVVVTSERKSGVGRALLQHAEDYAKSLGATLLRIAVLADNTIAKTLYLNSGFKERTVTLQKYL
jgi:GNAT superfamily N-acetyltransferase